MTRLIADVVLFNHGVAQQAGLGPSDAQFLTLLQLHGPMTAGELAARTGLTTGTTTGVIDRLERAGYAHRSRDPHDRRKVIVSPDDAAIAEHLLPHYAGQAQRLDALLRTRSADELAVIDRFLVDLMEPAEEE